MRLLVPLLTILISFASPARAAEPLRVVATGGRIAYTFYAPAPANTAFRHRTPHKLGGPVEEIQIGFMDWMYTDKAESANSTNDVTITHAWLERASTGQCVPLTFSGSRSLVLPMGSSVPLWLSDPVTAAEWTDGPLARDELVWVHVRGVIPSGGMLPVGTPSTHPGARFLVYPPTNYEDAPDVAGPVPAIPGGAVRNDGLPLMFLGRYAGPGHLAVIGVGDDILHGIGDSANPVAVVSGHGFFNRAAFDEQGQNTIATFNLTRYAQSAAAWINPKRQSRQALLLHYANVVVEGFGTNDLGAAGTGDPAAIRDRLETIWSTARAAGVQRIVRFTLFPRSKSTDTWKTSGEQLPFVGWEAGGKRDMINDDFRAALAAGKIDALVDMLAVVADPADPGRWRTDGVTPKLFTGNGTHLTAHGNALAAAELRAALLALTVR